MQYLAVNKANSENVVSFVVQAMLLRIKLKSIYNAHTTFWPHFVICFIFFSLLRARLFVCSFVRWLLWKQWNSFPYMIENNVPNLPYHNIDFTVFFFALSLYTVRPSIQFTLEKILQRINIILACKMTLHLHRYRCTSTCTCRAQLTAHRSQHIVSIQYTLIAFNERTMDASPVVNRKHNRCAVSMFRTRTETELKMARITAAAHAVKLQTICVHKHYITDVWIVLLYNPKSLTQM